MKGKRHLIYTIVALNFILCYLFFKGLPDMLPFGIIFNSGNIVPINKLFIYVLPSFNVFVLCLTRLVCKLSPKRSHEIIRDFEVVFSMIILYFTLLLIRSYNINGVNIEKFVYVLIGALYIYTADFIRIDGRYSGIATPWTIKSIYVKKMTVNFSKFVFLALGAVNICVIFFIRFNIIYYYLITLAFIASIYIYSFICFKNVERN